MLSFKPEGIYCESGDFYIDPWRPVNKAVITHAHADHSRWGMKHYLAHRDSVPVMKHRLGDEISVQSTGYGEVHHINGVKVSLHPAGHIIGSAQVRVEHKGEVWVVSGDYKTGPDTTCTPFEPVACHHFITESTFGLPIFDWEPQEQVFANINTWWRQLKQEGKTAVLLAYSLGKAQRLLQGVDASIGKIFTHGAVENTNEVLRAAGHLLPETTRITKETQPRDVNGHLVIAPPSAMGTAWMKRLRPFETAMVSGWMQVRGMRRRRNADRGFILSDHADWKGLNQAIADTGAENIYVTHGYTGIFSHWLAEQGYNAQVVTTEYGEEEEDQNASEE
jgi:putative mRNA 3-end processing factor